MRLVFVGSAKFIVAGIFQGRLYFTKSFRYVWFCAYIRRRLVDLFSLLFIKNTWSVPDLCYCVSNIVNPVVVVGRELGIDRPSSLASD